MEFSHTFKGYTAGGYKDQYFGFKTGGLEIKINTKDRILKVTESIGLEISYGVGIVGDLKIELSNTAEAKY